MKLLRNSLFVFLFLIICSLGAQNKIKVSEFLQESKIASSESNKLFFIDFWATWCGPCITAKEHLGVLQKQFPDDLYILSLTKENPLRVERFLENKKTDLAVVIDYKGETHKTYNVVAIPDGVLLNSKGEVLWKGGAPDLKKEMISKFLRRESDKSSLNSILIIESIEEKNEIEYLPTNALEIKSLVDEAGELMVVDNENYLKLSGSLRHIVSYLAKIYEKQIVLEEDLNTNYEIYFKKPFNTNENLAFKLISELKLGIERKYIEGEAISFVVEVPKFWNTDQIDWGKNNAQYLVGDAQIKADNVSLRDVAYQLAHVLDIPIIVPNDNEISLTLHDWDFHYKFFQLMQADLEDNFGIRAEKEIVDYPIYYIQKKAP
ncbi:TlpA family protein disulfide reductase [Winogradskyella psychrotolerans]|uniref:TlpA family protein disulfide reductase n=1 Tax=Winogradskyella psychrotolerans TaxID=1344585 RepID=UPI001C076596|nr:TlpA disulfide reductase family protein [Winogradskyella psychrotolerans]MBU2927372.1 TlpA family protein disulfide reductase [Winogradskyella psychrotolerans]